LEKDSIKRRIFFRIVEDVMLSVYYLTRLLTILPPRVLYPVVDAFGAALYYGRPKVRADLQGKIRDALGDLGDRELDRIGRGAYSALLLNVPDFLYWERHGDRFMRELEVEGLEHLEKADSQGKGVLIHMTHMGRSPLLHIVMARLGMPFTLVMWHPETTPVPRYTWKMVMQAAKLGCDPDNLVIWVGPDFDTVGEVREALAAGKRVGVPFDVTGKRAVNLFGRPAALADGLAYWAIGTGAPIVPAIVIRTRRPYRSRVIIHEPLSFELTGDRRVDTNVIMEGAARASEEMIREAPEQWMSWFGLWQWWAELVERSGEKETPA
jgi:lauroyl/myristoyl acyltransferase